MEGYLMFAVGYFAALCSIVALVFLLTLFKH